MRAFATRVFLSRPFIIICRAALAAVFIYASVGKIQKPDEFAQLVAGYRILPISLVNIVALLLPWVELLCAVSLLSGILMRSSGLVLAVVNLIFLAGVGSAMARGLDIECGCFTLSKAHSKVGWSHIGLDFGLLLICLPVILAPRKEGNKG